MIQLTNNIYAVEVPSMAFGIDINNYGDESELMYMLSMSDIADVDNSEETLIAKPIPPGSWRFLFTTKTATEEDARKVAPVIYNYHPETLLDEIFAEVSVETHLESLASFLSSKNLDPNKNYVLIEKQNDNGTTKNSY